MKCGRLLTVSSEEKRAVVIVFATGVYKGWDNQREEDVD
jgi:hypothetical protein